MTINERIAAYMERHQITADLLGLTKEKLQEITTPGAEIDAIVYHDLCKKMRLPLGYFLTEF